MIFKGAAYWNGGLWHACEEGQKEMADLMISKGAADCERVL